jgi:precorrin-2 dehydrogenase / sirohydrochlorin ferrochelatase
MPRLSISLDVRGKPVVVVGGGKVAARKCLSLIRSQADVTVVSPQLAASVLRLVKAGWVKHKKSEYAPGDLRGSFLVFAATDRPEVNQAVARESAKMGIPVNTVDSPALCSFTSPAVLRRGSLTLTVASEGEAPALSRQIRHELAAKYGREYALTVRLLGRIREKLLTQNINRTYNKQILSGLSGSALPTLIRYKSLDLIDHLLLEYCGPGFSLAELGLLKEVSP